MNQNETKSGSGVAETNPELLFKQKLLSELDSRYKEYTQMGLPSPDFNTLGSWESQYLRAKGVMHKLSDCYNHYIDHPEVWNKRDWKVINDTFWACRFAASQLEIKRKGGQGVDTPPGYNSEISRHIDWALKAGEDYMLGFITRYEYLKKVLDALMEYVSNSIVGPDGEIVGMWILNLYKECVLG